MRATSLCELSYLTMMLSASCWRYLSFLLTARKRCCREPCLGDNKIATIWQIRNSESDKSNQDHRLRSSASTVLRRQAKSMGDGEFWPRTESQPPSRLPQNSARLITSARGPLSQIRYKSLHWGLLGKWVKYNVFVPYYIYLFSKTRAQVRQADGFLRNSSKDVKSRRDVPFWGYKTYI